MIDLSFLTDEEQETILAVLKRDADLKKAEEERIKNLQRAVKDKGLLKYLTGEWFYETKLLRHQDRIHGSDIIKASMRSRQKPLTILELSQILPEKQSFVSSDNQDVYIPPELCGLIQACTEPRERGQSLSPCEIPQVIPKPMVQSPTKQRWNPFNSERPPTHAPKGERGQVGVEPMEAEQAPSEEPSPSFDFTMSKGECHEESPGGASESIALPMPITTRVVDTSQDSLIDAEGSPGGHTNSAAPRGILKHMPNSSSTDSLSSRLAPQEATGLDSPVKTDNAKESLDWLDRKQVRFSAAGRSGEQWQDGKELGEHGLLDVDSVNATEEENNNDFAKIKDTVVGLCEPLPTPRDLDIGEDGLSCESGINDQKQNDGPHQSPGDLCEQDHDESLSPQGSKLHSAQQESGKRPRLETGDEEDGQSKAKGIKGIVGFEDATMPQAWLPGKNRNKHDISVEAASDTKPLTNYSSKKPFHSVSPVSKKRLLGIFRRSGAKEKSAELVGSHKEKRPTEEELDDNAIILQTSEYADNTSGDNQINVTAVKEETKTPAPIEVRTLQLTALQNTNFKDLMSSLSSGSDYQQEPIESKDRVSKCPQRLSNLKAFWEKGNSGPKVIFTRDQAINENSTQAETDDSHNGQPAPNVESRNTLRMEWTERNEAEENKAQESKAQSNDKDIQKIEGNLLLDSPKQDGTYRASPILISDETDDSSAGSVTELPSQDSVATSLHTSLSCHNDLQQGDSLIPLPTQSLPDGNQPIKITNLKSFWEKEFTGPRIIVGSARAPIQFRLGNSHLNSQVVPSYSDLKKPLSIKEEEAQSSDNESKSGVSIIKPMTVKGFVSRSSGNSQSKSDATIGTAEKPEENQFDIKREVLFSQERSLGPSRSQSPRSRDSSDDELWRSPSKTCHPKVLPRESSSPKGSPLKTFPIDFALKTKDPRSELVRPTPAARQKKTSLPEAKQPGWIDIRNSTGIISGTPVLTLEDLEQATTAKPQQSNQNTPIVRQYKKASESEPRLGDSSEVLGTHFARSFVPQDYQYYLGAPEKAHLPPFNQEEAAGEPNVNISAPATPVPTTQARSQSRASSGSHDDASIPLRSTLKQRLMPSSKSLENLVSHAKEEKNKDSSNSSRGQLNLSVDDVSSSPTSSGPSYLEQMKNMSASVPALQEQEMDSDSPSESNMSLSSGMASMSSVSGSVSSIYNADFGDIEVQGTIQLAVNYVQKLGEFQIFVVQCRDLAVADPKKNRSDPYVKCYLLPDKTKLGKRKTSIKKKTLNPSYSEVLRFKILMEVLKTQKLNISVWHNDTFRRNSFLGEVDLDLSDWDYNNTQIIDHALKPRVSEQKSTLSASLSQLIENRGEMRIALRFLLQMSHSKRTSTTATGEVQIWVKDCKNLPPVRGVIIDPFVKCTVLPDTSKRSRQKTRVVKRTANPMFNHTMVYNGFRPEDLREACAEITIWDHDRLSNHYIGGLRLGLGTGKSYGAEVAWMDSTTPEAKLWERMMQSNGEWVEDILPLRMFAIAKSMSK